MIYLLACSVVQDEENGTIITR